VPSLQTSRRDAGRTSSWDSDLPQSITPGTDSSGEDPSEWDVAGVGADDEPPDPAGAEPAGVVATAAGDVGGDCTADAADVPWAEADELEPCDVHPAMSTPARAAPVSNVRRAAILTIFVPPLMSVVSRRPASRRTRYPR
jgi:hypothetical protein